MKGIEQGEQRSSETDGRPAWDDYFLDIVELVAKRATCLRRRVGAALVRDRRILATGYNGAPSGLRHCLEIGCLREQNHIPSGERHELCRGLHAEQNAIIQAALHGVSTKGATCYVTHLPCINCTKVLINAGILRLVYSVAYRVDEYAMNFLKTANIEICQKEFVPVGPDEAN